MKINYLYILLFCLVLSACGENSRTYVVTSPSPEPTPTPTPEPTPEPEPDEGDDDD